jgi:hypothetical protein
MEALSRNPFVSGWPKKVPVDSLDVLSIIYQVTSRAGGWNVISSHLRLEEKDKLGGTTGACIALVP